MPKFMPVPLTVWQTRTARSAMSTKWRPVAGPPSLRATEPLLHVSDDVIAAAEQDDRQADPHNKGNSRHRSLLWLFSYEERTPSAHSAFLTHTAPHNAISPSSTRISRLGERHEHRRGDSGHDRVGTTSVFLGLRDRSPLIPERAMMRKKFSAVELRRWARQCEKSAGDPMITAWEREQLLKMTTALFELARTEDWLNGIASVHRDPIIVEEESAPKTG